MDHVQSLLVMAIKHLSTQSVVLVATALMPVKIDGYTFCYGRSTQVLTLGSA